jgi:hypothetical protein
MVVGAAAASERPYVMQPQAEPPAPLQYATAPRRGASRRQWAWGFLLSGTYALACIPAVFIFEHFRWDAAPLRITSFFACVICVVSASVYLWSSRASAGNEVDTHSGTRTLAWLAIVLAGGFLLLVALFVVLLARSMRDF